MRLLLIPAKWVMEWCWKDAENVYFHIDEWKFVLCTRRTSKREKHGMCFSPKSVNHGKMSQHVLDSSVSTMCCHYTMFVWNHLGTLLPKCFILTLNELHTIPEIAKIQILTLCICLFFLPPLFFFPSSFLLCREECISHAEEAVEL